MVLLNSLVQTATEKMSLGLVTVLPGNKTLEELSQYGMMCRQMKQAY